MDNHMEYLKAQVAATLVRVEAMKAENEHYRAINGSGVKYGEDAFNHEADYIFTLSEAMR